MVASVLLILKCGWHVHVKMFINNKEYITFLLKGASFMEPTNPGMYMLDVITQEWVAWEWEIAEHKAAIIKF